MLKAVLSDFDGTLVTKDILDVVCGITGNEENSKKITIDFHAGIKTGLNETIIPRINFLKGVTLNQINNKLNENNYLMPGAIELFRYLKGAGIITILHSGNIIPVLKYYQSLLGIDYILGSQPQMDGDRIMGISTNDFPSELDFKLVWVKKLLSDLNINPKETISIGDAPVDRPLFDLSGKSIAVNPHDGIEKYATHVIRDNLVQVIPIIESYL